ncbi:MAG: KTSC domain-containing protein [Spirochaetes bacterium]|nr:KTSC domain-containing protein [Spirochaetota bacterium]
MNSRRGHVKREPVWSSHLVSAGYDRDKRTLEAEFRNNEIYQYYNVPEYIYQEMMNSSSRGIYFHKVVIKAEYRNKRIR